MGKSPNCTEYALVDLCDLEEEKVSVEVRSPGSSCTL